MKKQIQNNAKVGRHFKESYNQALELIWLFPWEC